MSIEQAAKARHTVKAYDASRPISAEDIGRVRDLLRFSASSTNIQPWRFVIAGTAEGRARVAKAAETAYPFNVAAIRDCSHVVVVSALVDATSEHLATVLAQEERDGRFAAGESFKAQQHKGRSTFVDLHRDRLRDLRHWLAKQVYLNVGQFLLGVAALGIDATAMEGVDTDVLDAEFGFDEQGYAAQLVICLGHSDPERDYNAKLPKSRLELEKILIEV
jgi:nitroreductase / dihydropteridine reductase